MNFAQFGVPLSAAMPVATQFSAGKITQSVTTPSGQVVGVLQGGENGVHYIRPLDANLFAQAAAGRPESPTAQQGQTQTVITLPITMPGAKPGDPQQTVQIQVVNPAVTQASGGNSPKYQLSQIPLQTFGQGATVLTVAYNGNQEGLQILDGQNTLEGMTVVAALQPQDLQLLQAQADQQHQQPQQDDQQSSHDKENTDKEHPVPVALIKTDGEMSQQADQEQEPEAITVPAQYLQSVTSLQDYLQKVQAQSLPLTSLHQFLKFNTHDIKRELITEDGVIETVSIANPDEHFNFQDHLIMNDVTDITQEETTEDPNDSGKKKKKYKKKVPKPKKPKPGQVHIATALDGTTLFCCPECHMAYPEKDLLEQHLIGHKIERRFICDICGAGLKRKEHLERHKLGHNPERPFVCSVCMKGFKRKEHLNLHFVIHSGEKTEICGECGKGFYRKDHLRKHTRSHVTRRAKEQAEKSQVLLKTGGNSDNPITELNAAPITNGTAQVTIQVGTGGPNSQIQIPVQIQVPQHQIQISTNDSEGSRTSTVVLPSASESISILPN